MTSNDGVFMNNWIDFEGYYVLSKSSDYSDIYSVTENGNLLGNTIIGVSH